MAWRNGSFMLLVVILSSRWLRLSFVIAKHSHQFGFLSRPSLRTSAAGCSAISKAGSNDKALAEADAAIASLLGSLENWKPRVQIQELEVGQRLEGIVRSIRPFGCFVDVGADRDGLVHISRMADKFISEVQEVVQPGQKVTVWVSEISEQGTLGLSMMPVWPELRAGLQKQTLRSFQKLGEEDWFTGKVTGITDYGVFLKVQAPSIGAGPRDRVSWEQALLPFNEMLPSQLGRSVLKNGKATYPGLKVKLKDDITVRVKSVDLVHCRLDVTCKVAETSNTSETEQTVKQKGRIERSLDLAAFRGLSRDQWLDATVVQTTSFGMYVDVMHPTQPIKADMLVNIKNMREYQIEDPAEEVEIGQQVKVRILGIDMKTKRMSGSMLAPNAR